MAENPLRPEIAGAPAAARLALAALPGVTQAAADSAVVTPLSGLTNRVYHVDMRGEALCLRLPGAGSDRLVDRQREAKNTRAAATAGVAPEVLHFAEDGTLLTRFLDGALVTPERLANDPGALGRVVAGLRTLHESNAEFAGTFEAFRTMNQYVASISAGGATLPDRHRRALVEAEGLRDALAAHPAPFRPCHCDPTGRNLLDTGQRVWLVDWEYSAMNDPMWDLAYFSVESALDAASEEALLIAYYERAPRATEAARLAVWKPAVELLAATWALVQHDSGNASADFAAYADQSFASAAERMAASDFAAQLEALHRG